MLNQSIFTKSKVESFISTSNRGKELTLQGFISLSLISLPGSLIPVRDWSFSFLEMGTVVFQC